MAPDLQALSVSPIRLLYLCCLSVVVCSSVVRSQQHIAVVGAGVHGLLAAIEVKQRGWDVTVFEKESEILPIIPTLDLNGVNYEYYSQSIYSSATFEKSAPNPALLTFASKYNQTLMPWTASAMQHTLYYDTVRGPAPYPAVWEPYFTSVSGVQELVQDLAEAIALLRDVGTNSSVPADLVEAGLAEYNASILDWAQQVQLPAYSSATEVWWYAVGIYIHPWLEIINPLYACRVCNADSAVLASVAFPVTCLQDCGPHNCNDSRYSYNPLLLLCRQNVCSQLHSQLQFGSTWILLQLVDS